MYVGFLYVHRQTLEALLAKLQCGIFYEIEGGLLMFKTWAREVHLFFNQNVENKKTKLKEHFLANMKTTFDACSSIV